jgi:hypothetical protein
MPDRATGIPFARRGCRHSFGLIRRHDSVFQSLQKDDRAVELFDMVDRRTRVVEIDAFRVRSDQAVEVA